MFKFFYIFIISLIFLNSAFAENVNIFKFTEQELSELDVRKVRGADNKTVYSVGSNENGNFLKAVADNAASGLGKEVKIDLNKTPFINITWKIEKDLQGINENSKKGHDFAARVFAVKKTGATPLSNRAINYVFSSNSKVGQSSPSPYTKKSIDNVLSTTKDNLNEWVTVKANVKKDFKKFHDLDVNELDGLAIMADTDNSKMKSISYFQNIYFSSN
jgi:predicted RNA-binding protein with RPS1 domain